ncbi:hypothetical protein [Nocardiopsis aegyptia]|uniref:Uncharacterized protein n=1 Tax=Nocardiopsis aegyptia TaxID=220378 RepID=A0A7Z0EP21_9ACTN|nr:hypothetical protein [Nocardiopsis aegyptia]NYJ35609.1 hypothetical protein [Nocardiopsis aegyptia]
MNVGILEEINDQALSGAAAADDGPAATAGFVCAPSLVGCPVATLLICVTIDMPELPNCP